METTSPELDLDKLTAVRVLGRGAMGTVFLVYDREADPSARCPFALKVVEKSTLHAKFDADRRARWEISVLARLTHPYLPTLLGSHETDELLAWAVPYCPGGDLNVLRYSQNDRSFSSCVIRFYVAEIVCALEYLHRIDAGRRKRRRNLTRLISLVSDKGLKKAKSARVLPVSRRKPSFSNGERSNSFVGTEEYVSPEVVRGEGHEFAVDWWALGILTYEMMYGKTPFRGKNRKETFRNVLMKPPEFIGQRTALTDLIERLLEKDPTRRLGYNGGATEIKEHAFFRGLRWDLLTDVLRPPFLALKEEEPLTERITAGGTDIKEYFRNLRTQQSEESVPPSPLPSTLPSPSSDCRRNLSLMEF
ncbi:hypothetical protein HHK36_017731 [Tetracentron sinense]|uniref:non-specific serine/threonine protein kinase n=1 Tax=Tetracentron sinense TaxID=13715 RepID=A0A834YUS8_TETSI|nr:hypothetical protein HHK36_017731 [Tetracentron sinense]